MALAATFQGGVFFGLLIAVLAFLMTFEWSRLVSDTSFSPEFIALAGVGALAIIFAMIGNFDAAIIAGVIAAIAAAAGAHFGARKYGWAALGAFYVLLPCVALIWLRNDVANGRALVFLLFGIVWMADIGAFSAGRLIGGPRISSALSPEKTWSGVGGGIAFGAFSGWFAGLILDFDVSSIELALIGALLGFASILGDLFESAIKRRFGVKDSGGIIPGHGGVLDRLDGMIFATVAMTVAILCG